MNLISKRERWSARAQEEGAKWVGRPAGKLAGLKVMVEGIGAGTHSEG